MQAVSFCSVQPLQLCFLEVFQCCLSPENQTALYQHVAGWGGCFSWQGLAPAEVASTPTLRAFPWGLTKPVLSEEVGSDAREASAPEPAWGWALELGL